MAEWYGRRLDELEVEYVSVDGVYEKARTSEKDKAAMLVTIGALSDGTKVVLSAVHSYRESTETLSVSETEVWAVRGLRWRRPRRQPACASQRLPSILYDCRLQSASQAIARKHSYEGADESLERDWERRVTFYYSPLDHRRHIRTTNPLESTFATLRFRTHAAKLYKRVERTTGVIRRGER